MLKVSVRDIDGKEVEDLTLDEKVFDSKVNKAAIYQTVNMYLANQRQGNASTKTRGEVSGSGKKPWRQKGTGRARVGSWRNPVWRGGGDVFGPHPRSYAYTLPAKIKHLSLKDSINSKLIDKDLIILKDLALKEPKTKYVSKLLNKLKIKDRCMIVFNRDENINFTRAARNIQDLTLRSASDVNAYDILCNGKLLLTKQALNSLVSRIKGTNKSRK